MCSKTVRVKDQRPKEVKVQTMGCLAFMAVSGMVREMARGRNLAKVKEIAYREVAELLAGSLDGGHNQYQA